MVQNVLNVKLYQTKRRIVKIRLFYLPKIFKIIAY